jgi:hypothetical protein
MCYTLYLYVLMKKCVKGRLESVELVYDVMSFMQQLRRASQQSGFQVRISCYALYPLEAIYMIMIAGHSQHPCSGDDDQHGCPLL